MKQVGRKGCGRGFSGVVPRARRPAEEAQRTPARNGNDGLRRQESSARAVHTPLETNMRHLMLAASATLALLIGAGTTPALAACDPGIRAIQYMHSVQMADGSIDRSTGETADYVIGAAAYGIDPSTL